MNPSSVTVIATCPGAGDPLAEAIGLTRRLNLPHIRQALPDLVPTAKAQRWDPAEVVRVLLAEEAAGRDRANLNTRRKRAGFPGWTFGDWDGPSGTGKLRSDDRDDLSATWQRLITSGLGPAFTSASTLLGVAQLGFPGQLVELDLTAALPD